MQPTAENCPKYLMHIAEEIIFRLRRMHELQTIVTDVCSVCLSVCPSVCHAA